MSGSLLADVQRLRQLQKVTGNTSRLLPGVSHSDDNNRSSNVPAPIPAFNPTLHAAHRASEDPSLLSVLTGQDTPEKRNGAADAAGGAGAGAGAGASSRTPSARRRPRRRSSAGSRSNRAEPAAVAAVAAATTGRATVAWTWTRTRRSS